MATVRRAFELSVEAAAELDRRVETEQRDASEVLNELLLWGSEVSEDDFTPEQWEMIRRGEAEADAGQFASDEEVAAVFERYRSVA